MYKNMYLQSNNSSMTAALKLSMALLHFRAVKLSSPERLYIEGLRPYACSESKMDIRKYFQSQASTSGHESVTQSKNNAGRDTEKK